MNQGFTKLFSSITESTIWCEPNPTRILWITMLAKADQRGEVAGSVPGIAKLANLTVREVEVALRTFMSPDKHSRTKDNQGRRIEEVDGGWRLLNYEKFRAIQSDLSRREYKRKWAQQHRASGVDTVDKIDTGRHKQKQKQKQSIHSTVTKDSSVMKVEREPHMAAPAFADAVSVKKAPQIPASPKPLAPFRKEGQEIGFDKFWAEYWRKDAKAIAKKSYAVHVPTGVVHKLMMAGLRAQRDKYMQRDEDKRPHASTWLNQERWNDEASPVATEPKESDFVRQMMEVMADDR